MGMISALELGGVLYGAARAQRIAAKMRADGWRKVRSSSWAHEAWHYGRKATDANMAAIRAEMRRIYSECSIGGTSCQ